MKKLIYFICLLAGGYTANACTTFFIHRDGQMVFGRNYDWFTGNGMVCTNLRGIAKTSIKTRDGETINWVSKYGSITFNQYGKEFPTGGMNEKGLVIELMWLDGTRYPDTDSRPAVGVLQWIQYHLDNCATVKDLIAEEKNIRIAKTGTTPLHYLVADASGNVATIEFLDGKMKVHTGKDLPFAVLTNDSYASSLSLTKPEGNTERPVFANNSIDRFAEACSMVKKFHSQPNPGSAIDYSFSILDAVAQGSHTKWSIVYDIANKKIHFKTLGYQQVKEVSFAAFDFSCKGNSRVWDMNQAVKGNINAMFQNYSVEFNHDIISRSAEESKSQITISPETIRESANYPGQFACKGN